MGPLKRVKTAAHPCKAHRSQSAALTPTNQVRRAFNEAVTTPMGRRRFATGCIAGSAAARIGQPSGDFVAKAEIGDQWRPTRSAAKSGVQTSVRSTSAHITHLTMLAKRAALVIVVVLFGCSASKYVGLEAEARRDTEERYTTAKSLFEERCKSAGVVIKRTVQDVEGIELTKIRQPIPWGGKDYFDPMYLEAAMAAENRGDDYIKQFLVSEFRWLSQPDRRGALAPHTYLPPQPAKPPLRGYRFVEYIDGSGVRFRCVPTWREGDTAWVPGQHRCDAVQQSATRYALDYEDVVDPGDRAIWIAGTTLKVIDKQTGEVIAQLTRFVWDAGFGVSTTGRWPWQYANSAASTCPSDASQLRHNDSRYFVDTVLIPRQEE